MLIKCPNCGKNISDLAEKCIHCGYDFKNSEKEKTNQIVEEKPIKEVDEQKCIEEKESSLDIEKSNVEEEKKENVSCIQNKIDIEKKETEIRICSKCNKRLDDGEVFCTNCGKKYNEDGKVFCINCGSKISENAEICPNCGVPQKRPVTDEGGIGWNLLGCCIPLVGLILYLIWKDEKPKTAKDVGKGALINVVCVVVFYALLILLGITSIITLF
ncbi:zinc-ribbon domain-containing protein [Peptacetobacter sp.]|uniref:zinc-ribbon domain-containing protein n=1 Tax=Peptacetobacter sp. TaxID=2991975 RepID=UPI002629D216|nr:zinc-ribbon domain-containing protein [Peptacetobacter sp.]